MPQRITSTRRQTPGGVPYTLANGYPKIKINANYEAEATEIYLIDPANFDALVADVMPTELIIDGEIVFIPRYFMPGTDFLVMDSISAEPQSPEMPADPFLADPGAPSNTYDSILAVTITYKTSADSQKQDQNNPETFLERSRANSLEVLTWQAPGNNTRLDLNAPRNPKMPFTKLIPTIQWDMTWKRVTSPNFAAMDALNGTVNKIAHPWLENSPPETVMFLGASGKQEFQYIGNKTIVMPWSISLKFATKCVNDWDDEGNLKTYGWNDVYNPDEHKWQRLKRLVIGVGDFPMYQSTDFNDIFKPAKK